jgi:arginyl-tRNA--protein-N-Asp/Glu arginylyltransferase
METVARWTDPPGRCDYQADHVCRREYLCVAALQPDEYMEYLRAGWRRFGHTLFRLSCSGPDPCRSLRVDVARFRPDRSQRRTRKANEAMVDLRISSPSVTSEKIALFDRFHAERSQKKGWTPRDPDDAADYARTFVLNPFPTQEWCYFLDGALIGVGYVDELAGGLSAIYFAHDPMFRHHSLGTWNVLSVLERATALGLPHVYLGYAAESSPSLQYKLRFRSNQVLDLDGHWHERCM